MARRTGLTRHGGLLALVAAGALLTACSPLPRPFADGPPPPSDLVRLSTANAVFIAPIEGLPPRVGGRAASAMAIAFAGSAMPARVGPAQDRPGYRVVGTLAADGAGPAIVVWQAIGPDGRLLAEQRSHLPAPDEAPDDETLLATIESLAAEAAPPLVAAIETDMDRPLEERMAAPAPPPLPSASATLMAERARTAPVAVLDIDGLPPRETQILRSALETYLRRGGHVIDVSASWRISGTVRAESLPVPATGQTRSDTVLLRVVWTIRDADGAELGIIEQANPVPVALMNAQFPAIALAIGEGGAQGIDEVLTETLAKKNSPAS